MSNYDNVERIRPRDLEAGDSLFLYDTYREIHSIRNGSRFDELLITLKTKRGGPGWTLVLNSQSRVPAKRKPNPFKAGTVVTIGSEAFLRQTNGWASKGGISIMNDDSMRQAIKTGDAKVVFEPSPVVEADLF